MHCRRPLIAFYITLCVAILGGLAEARRNGNFHGPSWLQRWRSQLSTATCKSSSSVVTQPRRTDIFDQLSVEEYYQVVQYLVQDHKYTFVPGWDTSSGIPYLQPPTAPTPDIDYIYMVESFPVPKATAVAYLDNVTSIPPERYARAVVIRGSAEHRDVMEYKVGPLGSGIEALRSEAITQPGEIPYLMSPFDPFQYMWAVEAVLRNSDVLNDLWRNITGGKYFIGKEDEDPGSIFPEIALNWLSNDTNGRIGHVIWYFNPGYGGDAFYLHPLPLTHKLNWSAADPSEWHTFSYEYCHQFFPTAEDLLAAFHQGNLKLCSAPEWSNDGVNIDWSRIDNLDSQMPPRAGSATPSPRQFSPANTRFQLFVSERQTGTHFSWLGWEGHVSVHPFSGIQLFDIKFKGERILYELSLQDQMVQYSGYGHQGQTLFSDSFYNLGANVFSLRPGLDCPEDAEYVSIVVPDFIGRPVERKQAVCFHEVDPGSSSWRHFYFDQQPPRFYPHLYGTRDTHFVVRSVATIGNYDYIYEVHFHLDGEIDVKVVMAGYMETAFSDPAGQTWRNEKLAPRVHKYVGANLHTHFSHWKVDLDVKGTKNSVFKEAVRVGTFKEMGLETPGWAFGEDYPMQYIDTTQFDKEQGYRLHFHEPVSIQVRSSERDAWGNQAGYAIVHGATSMELLPPSHPLVEPLAWCKYHVAFTQHKDEEWISHDMRYAYSNLWRSRFSLETFMQPAESLDGEDVVAWVSLTAQHIPRTEDIPLISNKPIHFKISPCNYFPRLQSLDVPTVNDFSSCAPQVGRAYNYSWEAEPMVIPDITVTSNRTPT